MNGFKNLALKRKIIVNAILFLLVVGALTYFIVMPTIKDIKKMRQEIEAQKIDLEKKYLKGQNLKKLSGDLKKIEPEIERLDRVFINQNRALEFITTLEEKATRNNISQKINLANPQNMKENQLYKKMPLQISTEGEFLNQLNYLINLETLDYYINIKSLELSAAQSRPAGSEGNAGGNMSVLISADTYWK
ncbi:type 4a pilus biogenesis protein PilO [Candidatus Falkowbacteria bacterium]|nr:type 4a pilus biogenesis protein PilO [Candidatus Falkowbacteria bacterium]